MIAIITAVASSISSVAGHCRERFRNRCHYHPRSLIAALSADVLTLHGCHAYLRSSIFLRSRSWLESVGPVIMLAPLLQSNSVRDIREALREFLPDANRSNRKADLCDEILQRVHKDATLHANICRFFLGTTTKAHIDMLLRCVGAIHAKTKADSIAAFIREDADFRRHADDPQAPGDRRHDDIPQASPSLHHAYDNEELGFQVVAYTPTLCRSQLRRRLWRAWGKAYQKKAQSRAIKHAIDAVLKKSSPCRTLIDFQRDVARVAGVRLDRGAALVFFHRRLKLALQKRQKRRRPRRKPNRFIVHADALPHFETEKLMMWENDTWLMKHCMLDEPAIRRHNNKVCWETDPPTSPESDGLYE